MKKMAGTCLLLCSTLYATVSFDESMRLQDFPQMLEKPLNSTFYSFFKALYEQHPIGVVSPTDSLKIPKIIHQIWLGSPFPEVYRNYQQSWLANHPDWEYYLWTDADIAALGLENREFYDTSNNYGERSDIARYEILYRFGGVYVDVDYECLKPLDKLHYQYDLYTGIQPLDTVMRTPTPTEWR